MYIFLQKKKALRGQTGYFENYKRIPQQERSIPGLTSIDRNANHTNFIQIAKMASSNFQRTMTTKILPNNLEITPNFSNVFLTTN